MIRSISGHYESVSVGGETIRAFVPDALPPVPSLDLSGHRLRLLERATLACGRLDGISVLLPDPDVFLYAYVRREALLSSQIEGTQSSLSDLLLFELESAPGTPLDDVAEVSNYVAALEHGLTRMRGGFPLSARLLREMHAHLLARGRGAQANPGEFRSTQNWIGGTRPGNAVFVPPPPHSVAACIGDLERFIHATDDGLPSLVRAGLAHVQFETIHPFLDGNGRVGRLLIAMMLYDSRMLGQPLLYLSLYLKQHRDDYYRLLTVVRRDGDWESWIEFFLEGVAQTAEQAVDTAHRLLALFKADAARVQSLGRTSPNVLRVFDGLRQRPLDTPKGLAIRTGVSYPTVLRALESLHTLGITREVTGRKRERVFAYGAYLDILSEGTQPL
jgi:Fic family protein